MVNEHMKHSYTILMDNGVWTGYDYFQEMKNAFESIDPTRPVLFFEIGVLVPEIKVVADIMDITTEWKDNERNGI